jgi:phenylpropionate dioxygenase-like ring-hydroxylating dioxygenase large terminal subunit
MFLKNFWYACATSQELGRTPLARTICNEPIVMYRKEDGTPVAMNDRCPHRKAALSKGEIVGDTIQCGYHGLRYDSTGACVRIPGQDVIPPSLNAQTYPIIEKYTWAWIWLGDPALADPATIPDYHWNEAEGWAPVNGLMHFEANYELLSDNLMDLSHETFVHTRTIGNFAVAEAPIQTRVEGTQVHVERTMRDIPAPPLFAKVRGLDMIDRYQIIRFEPPANIWIDARGLPVGTNDIDRGLRWMVLNSITPETERTCHYFWGVSRCFALDDSKVSELIADQIYKTFMEDKEILEIQQKLIDTDPAKAPLKSLACDAGNAAARRIVRKLLAEEQPAAAAE